VLHERLNNVERRIRADALDVSRRFGLRTEVADDVQRKPIIADIGGDDRVTVVAQYSDDRATAGRRLPNVVRQFLDA
jgi:hypothetical protein